MKTPLILFLLFGTVCGVNLNSVAAVGVGVLNFAFKIADIVNIVNMATDDHAAQSQELNKQLDSFKNEINEGLKELEFQINGVTLDAQLASDEKNINSCYMDFEYYMNSRTITEKDKLVACGQDVRKDFRQVAQIAKEEPYKIAPSKVYQDTIEHEGFCNTTNLVNIHNYLVQLYTKGCTTGIISERIRTNGTSNVIYNECQSNIHNFTIYFDSVLSGCFKADTCKIVFDFVKAVLLQTEGKKELDEYNSILRARFPWYKFMLFKNFKGLNAEEHNWISGSDGGKPSVASVVVGNIFFRVLWTPFHVQPRDSNNSFRLVLDKSILNGKYIGMNVTQETIEGKLVISGYLDHGSESVAPNLRCSFDEVSSGSKLNYQQNISFLLVLVVTIFCVYF